MKHAAGTPDHVRFNYYAMPEPNSGCWLWIGSIKSNGYGQFTTKDDSYAHRFAYKFFVGDIPDGLELDHLCRNRACVNPQHLQPVTRKENLRRSPLVNVTHCYRGHEFTPENTWIERNGQRHCRKCHALQERRRRGRGG